jgi:hypothetical protein
MFYGSGLPDMYRHAAIHVDKILKGPKRQTSRWSNPLS